ncbi:MAG TPA: histidine phosphatase family protein [Sunxiuqinia sp.]|nr:histidine phosphatase family protein [Sunxiuqinia sp.]
MIQLTIIRHGETIENANNLCQGQQQGTLSELGVNQAKLLAERLKEEAIDVFYSSDLQRTIDTSAEILKYHPKLPFNTEPLLRERYLASWEGKPFPDDWHWEYLPDGAETNEDMMARAQKYIDLVLERHEGMRVMAMTHGGLIRALRTVITRKPASEYFSWEPVKNTSVCRVELHADGKHRVVEMNNTDHLSFETPGTRQEFS